MKLSRRRFLSIGASVCAASTIPFLQQNETSWHGIALGADASIKISGDEERAKAALKDIVQTIRRAEGQFSLYDPLSTLSQLNKHGDMPNAPAMFMKLMDEISVMHELTDGLFDPTVQNYFEAFSTFSVVGKRQLEWLNASIGWHQVGITKHGVYFNNPDTQITLNGIAQGFVTDLVAEILASHGLKITLVNMGEYRSGSRANRIGVANEDGVLISHLSLKDNAVATSSPHALLLANGSGHIISPGLGKIEPYWRTVSVVAETATRADAFSTALALTSDSLMAKRLIASNHIHSVVLEDREGKVDIL